YHGVLLGPCNGVNKIQVLVYIFILCLLNICHYTTHIPLGWRYKNHTRPPSITRGMTLSTYISRPPPTAIQRCCQVNMLPHVYQYIAYISIYNAISSTVHI
ncbi:unnamed protein product, partial [Meganyctiphanes norvegica]